MGFAKTNSRSPRHQDGGETSLVAASMLKVS